MQYLSHLLHGLRTRSDSLECGRQDMKLLWLELRATVVGEQTIAAAAAQVLTSKNSTLTPSAYSGPSAGREQRKKKGSYC